MKKKLSIFALVFMIILLVGCGKTIQSNLPAEGDSFSEEPTFEEPTSEEPASGDNFDETQQMQTTDIENYSTEDSLEELQNNTQMIDDIYLEANVNDESNYIGEYVDDNGDPNLEIAKGDDGKYVVQMGIFRLTTLDDGIGELTQNGLSFTATDAAGNPISAVITIEDKMATVTFTDSTWTYIENGDSYQYTKSSDMPNLWEVY
jgi:hypothetical protein